MTLVHLRQPPQDRPSYSWSLVLPRRRGQGYALQDEAMNASELMFFFGAPLAHVVDYEQHLKAARYERAARESSRGRRAPYFLTAQAEAAQAELAGAD